MRVKLAGAGCSRRAAAFREPAAAVPSAGLASGRGGAGAAARSASSTSGTSDSAARARTGAQPRSGASG